MDRESVETALQRLLDDPRIAASPQMTAFICYVVEQTLDEQSDRIKAYSVGVDALGKPETFDPQSDASVRVLAARLRKTLERYNSELPGGSVTIRLLRGSYVPEFAIKASDPVSHPIVDSAIDSARSGEPVTQGTVTHAAFGAQQPTSPQPSDASVSKVRAESISAGLDVVVAVPGSADVPPTIEPVADPGIDRVPTANASRLPTALALILVLGVAAVLLDVPAMLSEEDPPRLASALPTHTATMPARAPVVTLETLDEQNETARQLGFVLGGVLARFKHLDVRQASTSRVGDSGGAGHYTLAVSVLPAASKMIIGVQIGHNVDGRLIYSNSEDVAPENADELAAAIDRLRDSVARLAQRGGPLSQHFAEVVVIDDCRTCSTSAMAVLDQQVMQPITGLSTGVSEASRADYELAACDQLVAGAVQNGLADCDKCTAIAVKLAEALSVGASDAARQQALGEALELGLDAVERTPQVAELHYALSLAFEQAGDIAAARRSAGSAVHANPFDVPMLLHRARLATDDAELETAEQLRTRAAVIQNAAL